MKINPEIRRAKAAVEKELLSHKGVTGVGVGEKITNGNRTGTPSIRVYVKEKLPKSKLSKNQIIPEEINGIPTDVVERVFELHPATVALDDLQLHIDAGTYDPLTGGIGIGPCRVVNGSIFVGTLGLVVEDNTTDDPMMLSNFHVMCVDNNWSAGDTMAQPGRVDGGSCPNDVVGELSRAVLGGQVDCAVARITNRGHNCRITEIGEVNGTTTAVDADPVSKRGRTTGLTHGFVDDISLTLPLDYGDGLGTVTLTNQIGITTDTSQSTIFGDHGDSGSVVVNQNNEVIGLYFAGSSDGYGVANPIGAVLSALNVHLCNPDGRLTTPWADRKTPWNEPIKVPWNEPIKAPWNEPITFPWIDNKMPWLDNPGTLKYTDDVKSPTGLDTLRETIQEGGGFTFQERVGGLDPKEPIGQPPGASPFALATPHHATGANRFEQQQQGGGYEQEDLDRQIEQARQYLEALESQHKGQR